MRCVLCGGSFKVLETRKRPQMVYRRLECVTCKHRETSRETLVASRRQPKPKPKPAPKPRPIKVPKPKAPPKPKKLKAAPAAIMPHFGAHDPFSLGGWPAPSPSGCSIA